MVSNVIRESLPYYHETLMIENMRRNRKKKILISMPDEYTIIVKTIDDNKVSMALNEKKNEIMNYNCSLSNFLGINHLINFYNEEIKERQHVS